MLLVQEPGNYLLNNSVFLFFYGEPFFEVHTYSPKFLHIFYR